MRLAFWRRKTIEEHLAPITKIVDGLKEHIAHHEEQERAHRDEVARREIAAATSKVEQDRAAAQMTQIAGVFGQ